jgi:hypothetical protein
VNPRSLIGTALTAAIMATTIAAAGAQTYNVPIPVTIPGNGQYIPTSGQYNSNVSVGRIDNRLGRVIRSLERDGRDYGGHRINAINDLRNARNELNAAKAFAAAHGYGNGNGNGTGNNGYPRPVTVPHPPVYGGNARRGEAGSNYSVGLVRRHLGTMIGHLQQDSRDYGGHRVAAINWMQQASNELSLAQQWEQTHPNG